jgi:hypothetical protein
MALPLLGILGGASSLVQGVSGIAQLAKAKKVKPRKVDQGFVDNVDLSRNLMKADKTPGQTQAETSIRSNAAQTAEAIQETGSGLNNKLAALSSVNKNTNDSFEGLNSQAQQFRLQNVDRFQNSVQQLAGAKQQAENEASATKSALQGAGLQNLFQGIQGSISNVAQNLPDKFYSGVGGNDQKLEMMNKMLQLQQGQPNTEQATEQTDIDLLPKMRRTKKMK